MEQFEELINEILNDTTSSQEELYFKVQTLIRTIYTSNIDKSAFEQFTAAGGALEKLMEKISPAIEQKHIESQVNNATHDIMMHLEHLKHQPVEIQDGVIAKIRETVNNWVSVEPKQEDVA